MLSKEVEKILPLVQKPARYTGGELNSVIKNKNEIDLRYAFCFPDTYEIGMSHLGMKILYSLVNERQDAWCERVFAPWEDMEEQMRKNNIPLYALESGDQLSEFDVIGFTLQYELCYTNVLNMLNLANIPVLSKDRTSLSPLVVAGGPCVCNPEPIADFVDVFFLGEGEEQTNEFLDLLKEHKAKGSTKEEFLKEVYKIKGCYVPAFYDIKYKEDGTIKEVIAKNGAPKVVQKAIISDMDNVFYPSKFVVPNIEIVHDRVVEEIFRGCMRGCRFCQAGFIYRPIREKSFKVANSQMQKLCETSGYNEASLCSLSTSDYSEISELLNDMLDWSRDEKVSVSLPSLRVDNFSDELVEKLKLIRRSGLTFAPEAGTQRLRDVINKNITEEEVMKTCNMAFEGGWTTVKLYFMLGLPTETLEDVEGITSLAQRVVDEFYRNPNKPKGKGIQVNVSASSFVPKPFTPFQWEPQDTPEMLIEKQKVLQQTVSSRKIRLSWHEVNTTRLEGVFARGDRRLCKVMLLAWQKGCKFDSWDDQFKYELWQEAFEECGVSPHFYASRTREYDEILPWDMFDYGISKQFFIKESKKSKQSETTENCRIKCTGCGARKLNGGRCDASGKN